MTATAAAKSSAISMADEAAAWLAQRVRCDALRQPARRLWEETLTGSVCVPLAELGEDPDATADLLRAAHPYIVVDDGSAYVAQLHAVELRIAASLTTRITDVRPAPPSADFFSSEQTAQADIVAKALTRACSIITGGPGTGKTWCVQRLLAALLRADAQQRIVICAPTGKAAARSAEALRKDLHLIAVDAPIRQAIDDAAHRATTVHRMLGWNPSSGRVRHHAQQPLDADVVVVDETSMVDAITFDALLAALPATCRLILLGDPCQLASVETGVVLRDLDHALAQHPALGTLTHSHRFRDDSGIGRVARHLRACVQGSDAAAAATLDALRTPSTDVRIIDAPAGGVELALKPCIAHAREVCGAANGPAARALWDAMRVLCVLREGPRGVAGINHAIERALGVDGERYPGRPIMILVNDARTGLSNGDVGVLWCTSDRSEWTVWFSAERSIAYGLLPAHDTCWAMTIHKAQGSEWDAVTIIFPDKDHELCTAELIYTAITRARHAITVCADPDMFLRAALRRSHRRSRLAERLTRALAPSTL